jgi:hypothetical protein
LKQVIPRLKCTIIIHVCVENIFFYIGLCRIYGGSYKLTDTLSNPFLEPTSTEQSAGGLVLDEV